MRSSDPTTTPRVPSGRSPVLINAALGIPTLLLVVGGLYLSITAPPEETQGEAGRLLFVHVPAVLAAYLAMAVGLITAVWYLIRRSARADLVSASSIEVGVVFTAVTLGSGMIWGRYVWGVWWDWGDARMVSTAVLFFVYVGYLALRHSITDPVVRATRCAGLAVVAFIQVPVVHYSVLWFRTLHQGPTIIRPDPANAPMDTTYGWPFVTATAAFCATVVFLVVIRTRVARAEGPPSIASAEPVGAAVKPPRVEGEDGD